ncbi:hypothetical protein RND81_04G007300 [Saponaria officinalis]|uniref:Synergin gamma C-terminal domain-containing protein n=1 Tax=Saponaria officinalis TaxID=3572 RepID=A0AAW1LCA7_SAPOF
MEDDEGFTFGDFVFAHPHSQFPDPFSNRVDPNPLDFSTRKGALPLSIFGEVEDEHDLDHNSNHGKSNGNLRDNDPKIVSENGSGLNLDNYDDNGDGDDDFGEWEFKGALLGNDDVMQGNIQDHGAVVEKVVVMPLTNKDASNTVEHKPEYSSFPLDFDDIYAALPSSVNKLNDKDAGFKSTSVMSNGFTWAAFPGADDTNCNGNGVIVTDNSSITHKPSSSGSLPQSIDLFADSRGNGNRSDETNVGHKSAGVTTNGFEWDVFGGNGKVGNGSEISDTGAISVEQKPRSNNLFPPSDDLFAAAFKADGKSSESDFEFKSTNEATSSFRFDAFPGVEMIGNISLISATSSSPIEHKPNSSSFPFPSDNLFVAPQGAANNPSETFGEFKKTSSATNGFMFHAFPEAELVGNGNVSSSAAAAATTTNEDDDIDDFGDFIDAFQEVRTEEEGLVFPHLTVASETQLEDGKSQAKQTLSFNGREALPLSLFGDTTEETSETLNNSDELFHKRTSHLENGVSSQRSTVSIHDLISNMYSQAQSNHSVESDGKPAENGVHNSQEKESPPLGGDDEWDEDSWEFKSALREAGVKESLSSAIPGNVAQIQFETSQNIQDYIDFYVELRNALCYLLSCQLDELQKARCSDTGTGSTEITETLDNEIQEVHKLLEQGVVSRVVSEKHLEKNNCLNVVFKLLEEPKFKNIESEFSLLKKLQLADGDWRVASDLLRHAISILKTLSLGSADEQSRYASTWSNVVDVCARELRYGALIWKRASEKRVQQQFLSDSRGQKHIQALGEIYKVVEILGLSAKVYKAWMLFSVSDSSRFMDLLNECRTLWSNSGLEEALQSLSDDIGFESSETSIKNICDFDVLAMHDCVFGDPKSICRLSLLAQESLPDLKTVLWDGEPYFLSLANLWVNLISSKPPQLPHVQVVNQTD